MGRFVIQKHSVGGGGFHWDLMLEAGDVLETYRLSVRPEWLCGGRTAAERIFDHPLKFLTYEGSVNEGKGSVEISDRGFYRSSGTTEGPREIEFEGSLVRGRFRLSHIEGCRWELSGSSEGG